MWRTYINRDMANDRGMIRQPYVLRLVSAVFLVRGGALPVAGRTGPLVDDKRALDVDPDRSRVGDRRVYFRRGGRCPGPASGRELNPRRAVRCLGGAGTVAGRRVGRVGLVGLGRHGARFRFGKNTANKYWVMIRSWRLHQVYFGSHFAVNHPRNVFFQSRCFLVVSGLRCIFHHGTLWREI